MLPYIAYMDPMGYIYIYSTFNIIACQAMQLDPVGNSGKFAMGISLFCWMVYNGIYLLKQCKTDDFH